MSFHRNQQLEVGLTPHTKKIWSVYERIKHNLEMPDRWQWHDNQIQIKNATTREAREFSRQECEQRLNHFRNKGNAEVSVEK